MPNRKELSLDLRKQIVEAYKAGEGYKKVAKRFNVSKSGVQRIVKKFEKTETLVNKSGRGRKRKISKILERKLVREASKNPRVTADTLVNDAATSGVNVSKKTVTRALQQNGLQAYRPRKTPFLKKRHLTARLKYANDNLQKDYSHWKRVIWSDETKIELFGHRSVAYVWRKTGEAHNPKATVQTVKHGGGNIML